MTRSVRFAGIMPLQCPRLTLAFPGLILAVLVTPAHAADGDGPRPPQSTSTATILFENDLFGDTDQQYTNGLQLGWMSEDLDTFEEAHQVPAWLLGISNHLPFINSPGSQHNIGLSVGQKMFTPKDTQTRELVRDDRPYAGWLYGGISFVSKTAARLDTFELQAGMVGPASLAEDAQALVHELRDLPVPQGWDNQLKNEPGLALIYEHKERPWRSRNVSGLGYDVITHVGGAAGNVFTYFNAGAEARIGWNLPADFGTPLITPGGDTNAPAAVDDPRLANHHRFGVHAFTAVTGRLVLRDIFLDGNTFAESHHVDKELAVGDLLFGVSATFWNAKLSYAQVLRSREFNRQDQTHKFGSLSLSITF